MLRVCRDCKKTFSPAIAVGGSVSLNYVRCPYCRSSDTAVTVAQNANRPLRKHGPPGNIGHDFNRKKPPTH